MRYLQKNVGTLSTCYLPCNLFEGYLGEAHFGNIFEDIFEGIRDVVKGQTAVQIVSLLTAAVHLSTQWPPTEV